MREPEDDEAVLTRDQINTLQTIGVSADEIQALYQIRRIKAEGFGRLETIIQDGAIKLLKPETSIINPGRLPLPFPALAAG